MSQFLTEVPVRHAKITSSNIEAYLQTKLGFRIDCDFAIWDNRAEWEKPLRTDKCFVIMRAIFRPEDITIATAPTDYTSRVLASMGSGRTYKKDVMDVLTPFMFPESIADLKQNKQEYIDTRRKLAEMGIHGDRLEELIRRPGLFYDQVNDRFGVYLRPERIIPMILKEYYTAKDGKPFNAPWSMGYVSGDMNGVAYTWGINIYDGMGMPSSGVTIDAVFNGIKA